MDDIRTQIDIFKNFKLNINEALKTKCQTGDAVYNTIIKDKNINVDIKIPFILGLSEEEAKLLEANIHNAMELVLKPYFMNKK